MNTRNASTVLHLVGRMKKSTLDMRRSAQLRARVIATRGHFGARFALVALVAGFFLLTIWANYMFSRGSSVSAATAESVSLFADSSGTMPKTSFILGDKAWAMETGAPLPIPPPDGYGLPQRRFQWIAPDGTVAQQSDITADGQFDSYQIPTIGQFAQVGTWQVRTIDNSNVGFTVPAAVFVVSDPAHAAVDLSVSTFGPLQVSPGSNLTYSVQVTNKGPNDAQNVQLTDSVPDHTTFVSETQNSGPSFECGNPSPGNGGTTTCTIGSLPRGATAVFTMVYQVDSDTTLNGTQLFNIAQVSNSVTELHDADNTTAASTAVAPGVCTLGCPGNITQAADSGQNGATVNYAAPSTSPDAATCGTVVCNIPSGSFFPIGTTTVVCGGQSGNPCSFTVTVTGALTLTLNGANPMTVECHDQFVDPGATASDGSAVTASGSVNTNVPGTYTITYTASDGTTTAMRTVNVVDTTAPIIALNGAAPMTVECHTTFTDPGATATDACAGSVSVTASGSVNANVPGTYTITYTATDPTGNTATAIREVNVVDTTPPVISCPADITAILPANTTATSMAVNYTVTATDACSGATPVVSTPASGSVFSLGTTPVTSTATDSSGNSSTCGFNVSVIYRFTGFFSPVGNLPTLNTVNAGRAIPVRFSLSGNKGLNIFASDYPVSVGIACDTGAPTSDVTETVTAGGSSLSYDAGSDQYSYVWKTDAAWAGTCRQLVIKLNDGTIHSANFKFR